MILFEKIIKGTLVINISSRFTILNSKWYNTSKQTRAFLVNAFEQTMIRVDWPDSKTAKTGQNEWFILKLSTLKLMKHLKPLFTSSIQFWNIYNFGWLKPRIFCRFSFVYRGLFQYPPSRSCSYCYQCTVLWLVNETQSCEKEMGYFTFVVL